MTSAWPGSAGLKSMQMHGKNKAKPWRGQGQGGECRDINILEIVVGQIMGLEPGPD